jgi:hypothetical protein
MNKIIDKYLHKYHYKNKEINPTPEVPKRRDFIVVALVEK